MFRRKNNLENLMKLNIVLKLTIILPGNSKLINNQYSQHSVIQNDHWLDNPRKSKTPV